MPKNPNEVASRWARNLAGSTDKIKSGVQSVTQSPGAKAAQNKAKYLAGIQQNADKWARNVGSVSLADWQTAMNEKAISRIPQGAQAAENKMGAFFNQLLPYIDANVNTVRSMPNLTLEDSVNRAAAWIRAMSKFTYKK
jgi:hypothetical protein